MMRNVDVVIATEDGPLQVEAQLVAGLWATIYYKSRFSVTHLPSGRAIFVTEDRLEAEGITVSLDKSFPRFRQGDSMTFEPKIMLCDQGEDLAISRFLRSRGARG